MKGIGLDNPLYHKEIGGFCISERSCAGDAKQKLLLSTPGEQGFPGP